MTELYDLPDEMLILILANVGAEGVNNYIIATKDDRAKDNELWYNFFNTDILRSPYTDSINYYELYQIIHNYNLWKIDNSPNNTIGHYLIHLNLANQYVTPDIYKYLIAIDTKPTDYVIYGILSDEQLNIVDESDTIYPLDARILARRFNINLISNKGLIILCEKLGLSFDNVSRLDIINNIHNTLLHTGRIFNFVTVSVPKHESINTPRGRRPTALNVKTRKILVRVYNRFSSMKI